MSRMIAHRSRRSGMALVIVLGMLTITLAVGYTMIRTAGHSSSVQVNVDRRAIAAAAARSGLDVALREMHASTWTGVNSQISGQIEEGVSFTASFRAGDDRLQPGDADYAKLPYRVTITAVGTAEHPLHPNSPTTEQLEAVVELVPRQLQSNSSDAVQPHTVYQWGADSLEIDLPARIEGSVYTQGAFRLLENYPVESTRPFAGHVDEVAIYSKALSTSQIQSIYTAAISANSQTAITLYSAQGPMVWWRCNESENATTVIDSVGNRSGVFAGAKPGQSTIPFSAAQGAALLDGINDSMRFGNVQPSGNRQTILLWFRPSRFSNSTTRLITSASDTSDWSHDWALSIVPRDGGHRLRFMWRTILGTATVDASHALTAQQWTFAAVVIDGNQCWLYQNGIVTGQTTVLTPLNFTSSSFVMIGDSYPGSSRSQLLRDQYRSFAAGRTDERLLTGDVYVPDNRISDEVRALCVDDLKVAVQTVPAAASAPLSMPSGPGTYRLYTGGPAYNIPEIGSNLSNKNLSPDVLTNPLGLFLRNGDLVVDDDVVLQGSLVFGNSSDDVRIRGDRVQITPVDLPILDGESAARQLPVAFVRDDTVVDAAATDVTVRGQWLTGGEFDFEAGLESMGFELEGSLVAERVRIRRRTPWPQLELLWRWMLIAFFAQEDANNGARYFPDYLERAGLDCSPVCTMRPDPNAPAGYYWPDFSRPLFEAHPDDGGLRWRMVRYIP